jgi:hypothetical protein
VAWNAYDDYYDVVDVALAQSLDDVDWFHFDCAPDDVDFPVVVLIQLVNEVVDDKPKVQEYFASMSEDVNDWTILAQAEWTIDDPTDQE